MWSHFFITALRKPHSVRHIKVCLPVLKLKHNKLYLTNQTNVDLKDLILYRLHDFDLKNICYVVLLLIRTEKPLQADNRLLLLFMRDKISSLQLKGKRFIMWKLGRQHVSPCRDFASSFKCAANERIRAPLSRPRMLTHTDTFTSVPCFHFNIMVAESDV
jgi:hypothetical protein